MRSNFFKATLKTTVLAVTVLLLGAGLGVAQTVHLTAAPTTVALPDGSVVPMWGYTCDTTVVSTATCAALNPNALALTPPSWVAGHAYTLNQLVVDSNGNVQKVTTAGTSGSTVPAWATSGTTTDGTTGLVWTFQGSVSSYLVSASYWSPVVITVPTGSNLTINLTNNLSFANSNTVPTSLVIVGQLGGGLGTTATSTSSPDHTQAQANVTWPIAGSGAGVPPQQGTRVQSFSTEVAAGATTALTWNSLRPGTYLIESGTHPSIQGPMGLYGILVVTQPPAGNARGLAYGTAQTASAVNYDAEIPLILSEIDPVQNKAVSAAVNTAGFTETAVWSGQVGGCGDPRSSSYQTCYPPAVNYTPLYYLINGVAFNRNLPSGSLFSVSPAAVSGTGSVLVRLVNAGLRMHVPSIVGSQTGTAVAPALPPAGMSLIAEDGNPLPGVPRIQSEVFMAAGKTYDVMVNVPASTANALPIFDRQLSLSGNGTTRDAGMLAYIGVNGSALPSTGAFALPLAAANPDSYNVLACAAAVPPLPQTPCTPLTVSDPSKGVIANDLFVFNVRVTTPPTNGALTLNADGTFVYTPNPGFVSDSFMYQANGNGPTATVTLNLCATNCLEANTGIAMNGHTYTSNVATHLSIAPPGILLYDADAAGYPLTVNATSVTPLMSGGSTSGTVMVDANGGFNATVPGPGTYTFTYKAQNSQNIVSSASATITLIFPQPSNLAVTVYDPVNKATITDYRWVIEEDRTFYVNPNCTTNPPPSTCPGSSGGIVSTFGTNFHTSYMPVVATGCTGDLSCESGQTLLGQNAVCDVGNGICRTTGTEQTPVKPSQVYLDPTKRYYISVLPGDAENPFANAYGSAPVCDPTGAPNTTCGHGMGGAPIGIDPNTGLQQTSVTILTQPSPYPPSKLSVFVFEDDFPLNGEQDGGGGIDVLSPNEPGLGGFNITLFDDAGGSGDATGQMTYDMFNMPLGNSLAGTIDPATGLDACPISSSIGAEQTGANGTQGTLGITGTIVTCPKYEADGTTLSPLAGQAVVANLMPGRYGVVATPAADRIARGEEWLQTNTLDGQKAHDSFLRIGEPSFFQEFGPAGYHVTIGFANPGIINARHKYVCNGSDPNITGLNCTNSITALVTTERMSRTPDERLYSSGDNSSFGFTQCYVSFGDPDGEDFAFTKCNADGTFTLSELPDGDWRITIFDQWNDMLVDGLSTPVRLTGGQTLNLGQIAMNQWQSNIYTSTFFDANGNGVRDSNEDGLTLVATNNRFRDGSYSNFNNTDLFGNAGFNEIFPLFSWYVIETDTTRYKSTGVHVVYDTGGPADGTCTSTTAPCGKSNIGANLANTAEQVSVPSLLRVPGAFYCSTADCTDAPSPLAPGGSGGSTGRVDPPLWFGSEGWQGFSGENNIIEFGKKPYAPGETGGIHGEVIYASTRPFDDPGLLIHTSWTPDVPGVTVNLYQEGTAPDGSTSLKLIDTTKTSSWDDWAQGFRTDGVPNMNCPGQGRDTGTDADLFFFTLFNQPMWLDVYANAGTAAHNLPNNAQFKCYDGMHNWNQVQPAPYDGMYAFPSVVSFNATTGKPALSNCHMSSTQEPWGCVANTFDPSDPYRSGTPMLPPGKYVVEMIVPPGYELVKEEDKNILIGDNYIAPVTQQFAGLGNIFILPDQAELSASVASGCTTVTNGYQCNPQNGTQSLGRSTLPSHEGDTGSVESFWPCVGASRIVPDYISLFPQSHEVSPFAGATRNLCDRKEVTLTEQESALAKFWIFTSAHVAAHFTGVITDDYTSEFDPFSPQFGEKFSPPNLPVSIKDWSGTEVSRVYSDQWGTYNGLTYSTWEVNPPNPTGYAPTMMVVCMNDPGPILDTRVGSATNGQMITDPLFNPQYSQFCYEIPFMPGQTQYMDTPVVPTSAFAGAGYNNPDCSYPDLTPAIAEVDGDEVGPWVAADQHSITITALGNQDVPNYGYTGPQATASPFSKKTVTRHYGFGSTQGTGTVTVGGVQLTNVSWGDTTITGTVNLNGTDAKGNPISVPPCAIQQQAIYSGSTAYCGQLVITAANGKQSVDAVTVTIGGSAPKHIKATESIQSAIDGANPGDLLMVDPTCTTAAGPATCATTGQTHNQAAHNEMVLMWKPVRLQGVGAASSIINANTHPAGKMDTWRRQVNCLFGLALAGTPITAANPYDNPNDTANGGGPFTCPATMQFSVDRLPLEATVGWDATLNGNLAELLQEPTLMGALEGAGITVLSKGVKFPEGSNPFGADTFPAGTQLLTVNDCLDNTGTTNPYPGNFWCNPASIDGLGITDSSQGGGGIFVHAWGHNLQIANNRIHSNTGTLSGGINVGQGEFPPAYLQNGVNADPGSCQAQSFSNLANSQLPYCHNLNVNVHHNYITQNSSTGDELFSATPAGAGGVSFCTGSDYYKFQYNWVCGNLSTGDGGGIGHLGYIYNGDIEHNTILFNQSTNPTIPTNGGGIVIMGAPDVDPPCGITTDQDCLATSGVGPSDGTGPNLVINANLIMGNAAESGSGGGLRLQNINGTDVVTFPQGCPPATGRNPNPACAWNNVSITNNIIANNVAGWDGAGISLVDALDVNIVNNTVMSNDTTASAGVLFNTIGAPLASSQGPCPQPYTGTTPCVTTSTPQPAGLVSIQNSAVLQSNVPVGPAGIRCPSGHGSNGGGVPTCARISVPLLENDIFWHNRTFYIAVGSLGTGTQNQQNTVALYDGFTTTRASSQGATGACPTDARFWDIGVRGDTSPGGGSGFRLSPIWSVLSSGGYGGNNNSGLNPEAVSLYCNGSRVPPEAGGLGYQVPPGISDATVPNPIFNLTPAATVDEGNNWINISWGPLSLSNPVSNTQLGDYTLLSSSPAIDHIVCGNLNPLVNGCQPTGEGNIAPPTDFFGNPRPDAAGNTSRIDVGAVEFQHTSTGALAPVLSSLTPSSGVRGTVVPVVLSGSNFVGLGPTTVQVPGGGVTVTVTSVNSTTITANFTIGNAAPLTTRAVTVTVGGIVSNSQPFTVLGVSLTSVSPNSVLRSSTAIPVVFTGANLSGATGITGLNGGVSLVAGSFHVVNATTVNATLNVPLTATIGVRNLTLTTNIGPTNTVPFTVLGPTLTGISPATGVRGTVVPVTISGANLTGTTAVTVSGAGVTVTGFTVANDATVNATFSIATGAGLGSRNVTVTTAAGNSASVPFRVVGGTIGFAGPTPALTTAAADRTTKGPGIITVTNTIAPGANAGPVTLTQAPGISRLTGTGTFSIVGGSCALGTVLNPGGTCTINVQYQPPATGGVGSSGRVTLTDTGALAGSQNSPPFNGN